MTLRPSAIPADDTLVLAAKIEGARVGLRIGLVRGPAPSCLSMGHPIGVPGHNGPSRPNSAPNTPGH